VVPCWSPRRAPSAERRAPNGGGAARDRHLYDRYRRALFDINAIFDING
jgi:hypothetical protein